MGGIFLTIRPILKINPKYPLSMTKNKIAETGRTKKTQRIRGIQ